MAAHDNRHPTQGRFRELLTSIESVSEFKKSDVVFCDLVGDDGRQIRGAHYVTNDSPTLNAKHLATEERGGKT